MENKSQNTNENISCEVKNCTYHDQSDKCSAKAITVGPTFAVSSSDTVCATFKPHQGQQ